METGLSICPSNGNKFYDDIGLEMTHFTFNSVQNSECTAAGKLSLTLNATLTVKFEELQGQALAVDKRAMCLCVSVSEIEKYMPL